jgi:hypothetical protein
MILRTYHISVIAFFLVFTNARTVQSATQNEVVKQPESPNILDTIHNYTYNHYSQIPNPSFHQRPNIQFFPFFQPMPFNPYFQHPFHNPHSVYMPPMHIDSLYKDNQFEDDFIKPPSYYWAEPGK